MPNSSPAFRMGMPFTAMPLHCFLQMDINAVIHTILLYDGTDMRLLRVKTDHFPVFAALVGLVVPLTYKDSSTFVFPWALSPYKMLVPASKAIPRDS